jgi:hypothetical protein
MKVTEMMDQRFPRRLKGDSLKVFQETTKWTSGFA